MSEQKDVKSTTSQKYKHLLEQANQLKQDAENELLADIKTRIDELNGLGNHYKLIEAQPNGVKRRRGRSERPKHCNLCNVDGHDERSHRHQNPKKKFTQREMEERGLAA